MPLDDIIQVSCNLMLHVHSLGCRLDLGPFETVCCSCIQSCHLTSMHRLDRSVLLVCDVTLPCRLCAVILLPNNDSHKAMLSDNVSPRVLG
jgi:hypothetical protein